MKDNNKLLIKLIVLIIVLFVFIGVAIALVANFTFNNYSFASFVNLSDGVPSAETQSFSNIQEIVIDVASLDVKIVETNSDVVTLYDNSRSHGFVIGVKRPNTVSGDDGTLHFKQATQVGINFGFGMSGDILVEVPKGALIEYKISNVANSIELDVLSKDTLEVNNVSGSIDIFQGGEDLEINTVSGRTAVYEPFETVRVNSVSGSVYSVANGDSELVRLDTVSGRSVVELDGVSSYKTSLNSLSGSVNDSYGSNSNGSGKLDIEVSSVSGSINLEDWR